MWETYTSDESVENIQMYLRVKIQSHSLLGPKLLHV